MTTLEKIRYLCGQKGITISALEKELGYGNASLSKAKNIPFERIARISEFFDVKLEYFRDDAITKDNYNKITDKSPLRIPVLGRVAAGIPIDMIGDIIDWEELPAEMDSRGEYFGLVIHGDSMEPRMKEGDVIIVRKQPDIESGQIGVITINGNDATCKRIIKYTEGLMLISTNPKYDPIEISKEQIESLPVRILGRVVELRAKFN